MGRFESIGTIQPFLKLQEGDWADVYKAYDTSMEKNVLLKRLKSAFENDPDIAGRFEEEARLMSRIEHPNVVPILSSGRAGNGVYFVAAFVEGISLETLLSSRSVPSFLAAYLLKEVVKGLKSAHDQGIFHRDIKPANILLSVEGEVKITDFGMASLMDSAEEKELRGTLGYLAPELLFEGKPGKASDLFSVGATFYEMLTGRAAFRGQSSPDIFDQVLHHDPIPLLAANPNVFPELIKICKTLLDKKPENRYDGCQTLLNDLDVFLNKMPAIDGPAEIALLIDDPEAFESVSTLPALRPTTPDIETEPIDRPKPIYARRWAQLSVVAILFTILISINLPSKQRSPLPDAGPELEEAPASVITPEPMHDVETAEKNAAESLQHEAQSLPTLEEPVARSSEVPQINPPDTDSNDVDRPTIDIPEVQPAPVINGSLNVLCTPFCVVHINGDSVGTAPPPFSAGMAPAIYQIDLVHPTLPTYSTDVVIESGKTEFVKIALRDLVGTIDLNVVPWANAYIDGVARGRIPPTQTFTLTPGEHTLTLTHDELGSLTDTLLVVAGEKQPYFYNMKERLKE